MVATSVSPREPVVDAWLHLLAPWTPPYRGRFRGEPPTAELGREFLPQRAGGREDTGRDNHQLELELCREITEVSRRRFALTCLL